MFCTNCGKELNDNAYACPYCGALINSETEKNHKPSVAKKPNTVGRLSLIFAIATLVVNWVFNVILAMEFVPAIWLAGNILTVALSGVAVVLGLVGLLKYRENNWEKAFPISGLVAGGAQLLFGFISLINAIQTVINIGF